MSKNIFGLGAYVASLASYAGAAHAVETFLSTQKTDGFRAYPVDDHGKLRYQFFTVPAVTVAGDADSIAKLCDLPPGRVRVLPNLSRITSSAFGSSRTLDLGHAAYQKRDDADPTLLEALNYTAFITDMDISSAVNSAAFSTVLKYDLYSKGGVEVLARVQGGTWPIGGTISGLLAYLYE